MIIAAEYISRKNKAVINRHVFGTDTYTADSDCVCIGIHCGFFGFSINTRKYQGVEVTFKVVKPKKNYNGSTKNGLTSQTIKNYAGNALKPESYKMLSSLPTLPVLEKYASNMLVPMNKNRIRKSPIKLS